MKKIIAMLLALVMVFSLAACNNPNEGSNPTGDSKPSGDTPTNLFEEHVTLKYILVDARGASGYAGWENIAAEINKITKEKINATIEFEIIPLNDFETKMDAKYIGGEEFDVVFTGAWNNYAEGVADGAFAELTQDMLNTYAADTLAVLNKDCWDAVNIGGKVYAVPLQQIWVRQNSIRFNADKADSYGFDYTAVKDLADIEPYLEQLKQAGEQYIFNPSGANIMDNLCMYMGFDGIVNWKTPGAVKYADANAVVVNQYASEEFLEIAKLMKKWKDAGYIHDEAILGTIEQKAYAVDINPACKPGGDVTDSASRGYKVFSAPIGGTCLATSSIVATNLAVGATSKNPERALAFINLLNTDAELLNLICHGIEGVDYNVVDKENNVIKVIEGTYPQYFSFLVGNVFNEYYTDPSQVGSWEETAEMNNSAPGSCILGFSFDATDVAGEIAAMQAVLDEHLPPIVYGEVEDVEAAVAAMNAALEAAGLQTVLNEMQSQINAWK